MFKHFRFPKAQSNKIELVSVHIPKTAGTSFRHSLLTEYGKKAVARLDIQLEDEAIKLNQKKIDKPDLPSYIKVLHGHFSPYLLEKHFDLPKEAPIVTWLRDPVERVASNYFYLAKRLREELQEEKKQLNILSKMQRSLLEYAGAEVNQNRMYKFLNGMKLREFDFVGIQEYFSEDLSALARFLKWTSPAEFHHNKTGPYELSEAERSQIKSWNNLDVQLYEEALKLREARIAQQND